MVINIKSLIRAEIIIVLYLKLGISVLGIPESAWYILDALNLIVAFFAFRDGKVSRTFAYVGANFYIGFFAVFILSTIVGFLLTSNSLLLYVWGWRNIGRMFLFWINCIVFLEREDLYRILKDLYIAFIINFILSLLQYFIYGIKGDNLGGIFGTTGASNSYTLNFIVIVTCLALTFFLQKKLNTNKIIICVAIAAVIAPLAELKAFYVLFVICILIAILLQRNVSHRTVGLIIFGIIGIVVAIRILAIVYPESVSTFTAEGLTDYLTDNNGIGYSSTSDLSRFGAVSTIHEKFFDGSLLKEIFGFGLGHCETSNFSLFNSDFYNSYSYLNYRWFFHAMTYLEMGALGLIEYGVFFISIFLYANRMKKSMGDIDYSLMCFSQLITIYAMIIAIYNSSLRIESGYLIYLVLAIPFIVTKCENNDETDSMNQYVFRFFGNNIEISLGGSDRYDT